MTDLPYRDDCNESELFSSESFTERWTGKLDDDDDDSVVDPDPNRFNPSQIINIPYLYEIKELMKTLPEEKKQEFVSKLYALVGEYYHFDELPW